MTVIEGVGEEVVDFLIILLITIIVTSAWMSTNSQPRRYRTVFVTTSSHSPVVPSNTPQTESTSSTPPIQEEEELVEDIIPLTEVDVTMAAENNRLHFYSVDEPSESEGTEDGEVESETDNAQVREMDSIVHAMEADRCRDCEYFNRPRDVTNNNDSVARQTSNVPNHLNNVISNDEAGDNKINIKLKYLNDSSKDVVGSLNELLKDFKLRHFSKELTAQLTVKIIFKGRLLADESTLGECGVHDHAVLHCLVHPLRQRSQPQVVSEEPRTVIQQEMPREINAERVWDLENVLMTLVSVALTVVWFLRCEYSNMFTASASVALFGLTVFYGVAIFGLYLSDTLQFNQRPRQRVPDN